MFTQRLREWGVFKNIGSQDVLEYLQQMNAATRRSGEAAASVTIRGRVVSRQRFLNHIRRSKIISQASSNETGSQYANLLDFNSQDGNEISTPCQDIDPETIAEDLTDMQPAMIETTPTVHNRTGILNELSSEELTSFHIAVLQTDFHYQQDYGSTTAPHDGQQVRNQLSSLCPSMSLSGPQELEDLRFVLHNSDMSYARYQSTRNISPEAPGLCTRQQSQAKDFYARHWLALNLLSDSRPTESQIIGMRLMDKTCEQVKPVLVEDHPHFLTWFAFVVCYQNKSESYTVQNQTLQFTLDVSQIILDQSDPRVQIQQCLWKSEFRESICLILLRHVISIFRQKIQGAHLKAFELLARLFNSIEPYEGLDENSIENTLQIWARSSSSIAAVINEDQKANR